MSEPALAQKPPLPLTIRPAVEDDLAFVRSTWQIGLAKTVELRGLSAIDPEASLEVRRLIVDRTLSRAAVSVDVAELEGTDVLVGCVVYHELSQCYDTTIYWLYVKHDFRGAGAGRRLLDAAGGVGKVGYCATWTPVCRKLGPRWKMRPAAWLLGKVE